MSRNLCQTNCAACSCEEIALEEAARPITASEAGAYFDEYEGMLVANAHCSLCKALYLAWCDEVKRIRNPWRGREVNERGFGDLSWRHAFNDEPSIRDLPLYVVNGEARQLVDDLHRAAVVDRRWPFVYADAAFNLQGASSWNREAVDAWTERMMAEVSRWRR